MQVRVGYYPEISLGSGLDNRSVSEGNSLGKCFAVEIAPRYVKGGTGKHKTGSILSSFKRFDGRRLMNLEIYDNWRSRVDNSKEHHSHDSIKCTVRVLHHALNTINKLP